MRHTILLGEETAVLKISKIPRNVNSKCKENFHMFLRPLWHFTYNKAFIYFSCISLDKVINQILFLISRIKHIYVFKSYKFIVPYHNL